MSSIKLAALVGLVAVLSAVANADTIVQVPTGSFSGATNQNQALSKVVVGGTNVVINTFGVYGQAQVAGNLKWVIFDAASPSAPVYVSPAQAVAARPGTFATMAQWYDSPEMSFTLLAGHTYAMGVMADKVGTGTFYWGNTYSAFGGGATVSGGGLSLPFMQALCNSGLSGGVLAGTPSLYTADNSNRYQMSLRIVPEPATLGLLITGGIFALRKRRA